MDIKFIRDDTEAKAIKELNEILDVLSEQKHSREVYAAKRFLLALFYASRPPSEAAPIPDQHPTITIHEPAYIKAALSNFSIPIKIKNRPRPSHDKVPVPSHIKSLRDKVGMPKPAEPPVEAYVPAPSVKEEVKGEDVPMPPVEVHPDFEKPFLDYEKDYPLTIFRDRAGVAVVRSALDKTENGMTYNVVGPSVDVKALGIAKDLIAKDIRKKPELFDDEKFMRKNLENALKKAKVPYSDDYADKLRYFLKRDLLGFGRVDPFLQDPNVKSVICDGVDKPVRVSFDNNMEVTTNVVYSNAEELNSFVKYLASKAGSALPGSPNFEGVVNSWKVDGTVGFGSISSKFIIQRP
jgi:hypothetical protein